jgi:putative tricarboxylic transport membrane protein
METVQYLLTGFGIALSPATLFYCFIGVLWGTVVGILPGLGPLGGIAVLLPLTFKLDSISAIVLLTGIFYGAMYGGSVTSILLNIPGEAASVITCIDGYQMARQGRAGPALVVAALGSFIGGTLSVIGLMLFAPPLAKQMVKIGPAEEFSLILLALLVLAYLSGKSKVKTAAMIFLGLLIATVGLDPFTGYSRFTFDIQHFAEGINFVPLAIGLFGVSEILINFEEITEVKIIKPTLSSLYPKWKDLKDASGAMWRGSVIGFFMGLVPGISHITSTSISYVVEKKLSKYPEEFGKGRIEGVAGPETANNATTGSAMIPLLVLGIPAIPATALLITGLLIHGIMPGPRLIADHPNVFWGLIASMYVGNVMLVILNLPLVPLFVNILRLRYAFLAPAILLICIIGVYTINTSTLDIYIVAIAGLLGYCLRKFDFDLAPLVMAIVFGDKLEINFRRALTISEGDLSIFGKSTFSKIFLLTSLGIIILQIFFWMKDAMVRRRTKGVTGRE